MNQNNEIFNELIKEVQACYIQSRLKAFADDKHVSKKILIENYV